MGASRFVSMGWALLAALCLAVVPAAAGENPMVGDSIRKVESQLGDLSALPRGKRLGGVGHHARQPVLDGDEKQIGRAHV